MWPDERWQVARRCVAFLNQNVQSTPFSEHLEVEMLKKCMLLWRKAHFEVMLVPLLDVAALFCVAGAKDSAPCQRSKTLWLCSSFRNVGRRGTCEEDLQRGIFRGRRSTRDMFIRDVRRWFPKRGCILEHQLFWFGKMILCDRCRTFVWPGITFSLQAQHFTQMEWKKCKMHLHEAVSSALNFHFWRKSRRIASFLMLSTSKIQEVSWGSLAELLRFWCCQVQKLTQTSFVFMLADREIDDR